MGSAVCRRSKATSRTRKSSRPIRLASSTSTSPEVRTEEGKLYLFVAIDRTTKIAFAKLEREANRLTATAFLEALIEAIPYKIHTVLTDNGIQFAYLPKNRNGPMKRKLV